MDLVVTGVNFRSAPLVLRERLSFRADDIPATLQRMSRDLPHSELALLSTCNRTELYVTGPDAELEQSRLVRVLLADGGSEPGAEELHRFYRKEHDAAAAHLMAVASSLDSMVVGETEILGQAKEAYRLAVAAETVGKTLNAVFQHAFRVAKRVRSETAIAAGRVSVASIAIDLAERVFDDLTTKTALIVGAGDVGEQTMGALTEKGVRQTFVLNRSVERGRALADRYGATAVPFQRLNDYLLRADVVVSTTASPHTVISADAVRNAGAARHGRPILLIDLAVPRDIEQGVVELDNVYLYNIDDLQSIADENLARCQEAVVKAMQIISAEAEAVAATYRASVLGIGELMEKLDRAANQIRQAEMARAFAKEKVAPRGEACTDCQHEMDIMLHRVLAKVMAAPKRALNEAARNGSWEDYSKVAEHLLGLQDTDNEDSR